MPDNKKENEDKIHIEKKSIIDLYKKGVKFNTNEKNILVIKRDKYKYSS